MSYFCGLRLSGFNETKTEMFLKNQLRRFARRCWVMTRRHPLLPFLLLATFASNTLLVLRDVPSDTFNDTLFLCQVYLLLAQCNLLGIWLVSRFKGLAIRLLVITLGIALYYQLLYLKFSQKMGEDDDFPTILATFVILSSVITILLNGMLWRKKIVIPRYNVRSLLLLSTSTAITCAILKQANYPLFNNPEFYFFSPLVVAVWRVSRWPNSWGRNLLLILLWPMHLTPLLDLGDFLSGGRIHLQPLASSLLQIGWILSSVYLFALVWSLGLQYKSQPKRRKREQATLVKPEQPVRVPNQDVDPIDSSQPTEPDDKANDEPPGPIDLTV